MNRKHLKAGLLLVLSSFALAACSNEAKSQTTLPDYESPIVSNSEGKDALTNDIYNNLMTSIYDDIHDGSLPSDTLDKVLYKFSVSVFGRYNQFSEGVSADEVTITAAVAAGKDSQTFKDFIAAHKVYQVKNDQDVEDLDAEFKAVSAKLKTIKDRVAKKMHEQISSDTYAFRQHFYESKFLKSLTDSNESVANGYTTTANTHEGVLLDPTIEPTEVFDHFLNESLYGGSEENKYIETKLLPSIYRDLLTEQYILEKSYASIGRSYARKVNIIEVATNSEDPLAVKYMMRNYFASTEAYGNTNTYSFVRAPKATLGDNKVTVKDFHIVSDVVKGANIEAGSDAQKALKEIDSTVYDAQGDATAARTLSPIEAKTIGTETYWSGTEYANIIKDYSEIYSDSSKHNKFSGNGTYSVEVGKQIEEDKLDLTTHVKSGWFIKSDLSSYPFADQLFQLQVAANMYKMEQDPTTYDRYSKVDDNWVLNGREKDDNKYICRINGSYFLKNTDNDSNEPEKDILFTSGNSYYIVQIEEAVSASRWAQTSAFETEDVKNEVLKLIANTGSYASLAKEYWLEKMNIQYYDQSIYDYFKNNYPDLFE